VCRLEWGVAVADSKKTMELAGHLDNRRDAMSTLKRTAAALTLTAFTGATFAQAPLQKSAKAKDR